MKLDEYRNKIKKRKNPGNLTPCHSSFSAGIICGPHRGSFAVQFGDHFRSGDHLRSGIICGAVQYYETKGEGAKKIEQTNVSNLPWPITSSHPTESKFNEAKI